MISPSQFWEEGGWGMYPVLLLALIVLAAGLANIFQRSRLLLMTTLVASVLAVVAGVEASAWSKQQIENAIAHATFTPEQQAQIREQGGREGHRPTEFGVMVAALGLLLLVIGAVGGQRAKAPESQMEKSWGPPGAG